MIGSDPLIQNGTKVREGHTRLTQFVDSLQVVNSSFRDPPFIGKRMKLRDSLPNNGIKEIVIFAIDRKPTENIHLNGLFIDRAVSARGGSSDVSARHAVTLTSADTPVPLKNNVVAKI